MYKISAATDQFAETDVLPYLSGKYESKYDSGTFANSTAIRSEVKKTITVGNTVILRSVVNCSLSYVIVSCYVMSC